MKRPTIRWTIGLKLGVGFFAVVTMIAVVGYVAMRVSEKALEKAIGENARRLASKTMREIDVEIYSRAEQLRIYALAQDLSDEASASNAAFDSMPDMHRFISATDADWIANKNTPAIERVLNNELSRNLNEYLQFYELRYGYRVLAEMYVTNRHGVVIGATGRTSDYLQADEDWYKQAVAETGYWVGDVEYDESSDTVAIDVVLNLYDQAGNFAGIFKGVLNVEDIHNAIHEIQARSQFKNMRTFLVDKQGLVIFSGVDAEQARIGSDVKLKEFGDDVSDRVAVQRAISGVDGFLVSRESVGAEEKELLTAFSHSKGFRDFASLGWSLIVEHDKGDILGPVGPIKRFLMIISGTSISLALLITAFISSSISRRIKKLTRMAEDIARGELDITADETQSQDEIGRLAVVFSEMSTALRGSYGRLEERVRERTQELSVTNEQLTIEIAERKRAEETLKSFAAKLEQSNRELEDFASVAAHDLQEPLRKIQTFGERLRAKLDGALTTESVDYLERMQNAAVRMRTLINDLLTFSRVTTEGSSFVRVDLSETTQDVVSDLEVGLEEDDARVTIDQMMTIDADPLQMRQLLQNLISNGVKFRRPEEPPVIRISGRLLNGHGDHSADDYGGPQLYEITVVDNGIGFEERYLERIFTIFQRLHGRGQYEGTGIGLAVCRKIAERHGGTITAKSTPDNGSKFIVQLPVKHPVAEGGQ